MPEKHPLILKLEKLVQTADRAALAELRRGLRGGTPSEVFKYLSYGVGRWQEDAALTVAPLFAFWHQGKRKVSTFTGNLGKSVALIKGESDSIEKRFTALLNCHRDDLSTHLRYIISLLKSKDKPVDWNQLFHDIQNWGHDDKFVQRNWARSFWTRPAEEPVISQ